MTQSPDTPLRQANRAGEQVAVQNLIHIPELISAYYTQVPDASIAAQRVSFGTSGHRGSAPLLSFNEGHILAVSQAICEYRQQKSIDGPLFLGMDTHALSVPALSTALEVLAANGVHVLLAVNDEYTPTPALSHAILGYNHGRSSGWADGIIITPSHNPPEDGGFKYNPPNGGPADTDVTRWIENRANELLLEQNKSVRRMPLARALRAATTARHDYIGHYVADLKNVVDMEAIRSAKLHMGVDPLGGAGVHYWQRIAEHYGIDLTVVRTEVEADFRFMTLDWDGRIRMDPSSRYAMAPLIHLKDQFDIAFACDTDHDRHGIVTRSAGLLAPNHMLAVSAEYLFNHRPHWSPAAAIGKTLVSSSMIDKVAGALNRRVYEVPVGFKWFVDGLQSGQLGFVGEESAGASFLRRNGEVWTTDKDGLIPCLLAAEICARTERDPGEHYRRLEQTFGQAAYTRIDQPASLAQKQRLLALKPDQISCRTLAGEPIQAIMDKAPGNGAGIGGLKIVTENGWCAMRPSGTENIYKIYAESLRGDEHLQQIVAEANALVASLCPN